MEDKRLVLLCTEETGETNRQIPNYEDDGEYRGMSKLSQIYADASPRCTVGIVDLKVSINCTIHTTEYLC